MQSEDLPTSQPPPSYYSMQSGGSTSWPPPPGYYPGTGAPSSMQPTYGSMQPAYGSVHSTTIVLPNTVLAGGCPACRVGTMEDDFTCLGLLCALLCFPFGIIYCLLCRTRRCSNCGAYFD
ncbi:Brain protein I3 [Habropoda laboriosa]|uniref:Membrane protein BRI3 n=2 Tax=Habropoda laboriosa TaxID=597456 RepID=A0A0L7RAH4_9HYME|nr:Brain protein I3 [Habropoda laboriosa]